MTDHVKKIKDLAAATKNAQAMTGAGIVAAIHTMAAAMEAHFDYAEVQELHTDEATTEHTTEQAA